MTSFAVSSGRRVPFQASTCFRIGSKFRCMRSTPTERMSTRLRCLVCLASTGVNKPGTILPSPTTLKTLLRICRVFSTPMEHVVKGLDKGFL